jgi:hypothetical protein
MNPIQLRLLNFYRDQFNMKEGGLSSTFRNSGSREDQSHPKKSSENDPNRANVAENEDFAASGLKIVRNSNLKTEVYSQEPFRRLYTAFRKGIITDGNYPQEELEVKEQPLLDQNFSEKFDTPESEI